ncbi:MAG: hypothetical protein HY335_07785 [Deinococcus sp.]|nr:hypothetical protein [Deinococcus sp.]
MKGKAIRRKVSTLLDDSLFRRTRLESVRQGKQISEVIGEALELYLSEKGSPQGAGGVVTQSWGVLSLDKEKVKALLVEEDGLLEA